MYDTLLNQNLNLKKIEYADDKIHQSQNLALASKLYSVLLNQKYLNESFNNISKLIILMLSVPEIKITSDLLMEDKKMLYNEILYEFEMILKKDYGSSINEYFQTLEKIPLILKELSEVSNKQKLDYCNIERLLMKLYVKNIHDRVSNVI